MGDLLILGKFGNVKESAGESRALDQNRGRRQGGPGHEQLPPTGADQQRRRKRGPDAGAQKALEDTDLTRVKRPAKARDAVPWPVLGVQEMGEPPGGQGGDAEFSWIHDDTAPRRSLAAGAAPLSAFGFGAGCFERDPRPA